MHLTLESDRGFQFLCKWNHHSSYLKSHFNIISQKFVWWCQTCQVEPVFLPYVIDWRAANSPVLVPSCVFAHGRRLNFSVLKGGGGRLQNEQNWSVGEGWREHGSAFVPREENGKRDGFERQRFVLQLSSSDITGEDLLQSSDARPHSHDSGQHFIWAEQNTLNISGQFCPWKSL